MYTLSTLYKDRKMKIINVSKTTTKTKDENENENEDEIEDERRKRRRSKRTEEGKKNFQNKCVSSQQTKCAKMAPP